MTKYDNKLRICHVWYSSWPIHVRANFALSQEDDGSGGLKFKGLIGWQWQNWQRWTNGMRMLWEVAASLRYILS